MGIFNRRDGAWLVGNGIWWLITSIFEDNIMGKINLWIETTVWYKSMLTYIGNNPWLIPSISTIALGLYIWLRPHKPEINIQESQTKNISLVWLGEDVYWLRDSDGGLHRYDTTTEDSKTMLVLEAGISVNTMKLIQVESVELDMAGTLIPSNWTSDTFYQPLAVGGIRFDIPLSTSRGTRTARVQAIIDGAPYLGKQFTLDLPHRQ